jgi:hypothetical protein
MIRQTYVCRPTALGRTSPRPLLHAVKTHSKGESLESERVVTTAERQHQSVNAQRRENREEKKMMEKKKQIDWTVI